MEGHALPQALGPTKGPSKITIRPWCLAVRKRRSTHLRAGILLESGDLELGWRRNTDMQLGTLIGTGSYGLVRTADLNGQQVGGPLTLCSSER